jgi:hypothetical protein
MEGIGVKEEIQLQRRRMAQLSTGTGKSGAAFN